MVYMDFPIKIYKLIRYGWTLEKDSATGQYIYGSIPRATLDAYGTCKMYLKLAMAKTPSYYSKCKSWVNSKVKVFHNKHPVLSLWIYGVAASVAYMFGVSVVWALCFKLLKFLRLF